MDLGVVKPLKNGIEIYSNAIWAGRVQTNKMSIMTSRMYMKCGSRGKDSV